jgi:hypothetical protein
VASPARPEQSRFSETIRLPRQYLVPWIIFDCLYVVFFTWLWAIATMTSGQRVFTALFLGAIAVFLFGGALWFVAMRVAVDDRALTLRVGHRRTRFALDDIARVAVESTTLPALDRVVVTLADGSEQRVLTRRADAILAALGGPGPSVS